MNGEDAEDRLFGLMEIAERQQADVQAALEALTVERKALAQEREAFASEAIRLEASMRQVVHLAIAKGFADAGEGGVEAVKVATQPLIGRLERMTAQSERADTALRRVVSWASWRLLGWVMALAAVLLLLGWLAAMAVIWWDSGEVRDLRSQAAQLQLNLNTWTNAGLLDKLTFCDPGNRPCIQVNESAGAFGTQGDYRVLKGY